MEERPTHCLCRAPREFAKHPRLPDDICARIVGFCERSACDICAAGMSHAPCARHRLCTTCSRFVDPVYGLCFV